MDLGSFNYDVTEAQVSKLLLNIYNCVSNLERNLR